METEEHVEVLLCGYVPEVSRSVKPSGYICGDCGQSVMISSEATVRCGLCGYRILYKARQRHCRHSLCLLCPAASGLQVSMDSCPLQTGCLMRFDILCFSPEPSDSTLVQPKHVASRKSLAVRVMRGVLRSTARRLSLAVQVSKANVRTTGVSKESSTIAVSLRQAHVQKTSLVREETSRDLARVGDLDERALWRLVCSLAENAVVYDKVDLSPVSAAFMNRIDFIPSGILAGFASRFSRLGILTPVHWEAIMARIRLARPEELDSSLLKEMVIHLSRLPGAVIYGKDFVEVCQNPVLSADEVSAVCQALQSPQCLLTYKDHRELVLGLARSKLAFNLGHLLTILKSCDNLDITLAPAFISRIVHRINTVSASTEFKAWTGAPELIHIVRNRANHSEERQLEAIHSRLIFHLISMDLSRFSDLLLQVRSFSPDMQKEVIKNTRAAIFGLLSASPSSITPVVALNCLLTLKGDAYSTKILPNLQDIAMRGRASLSPEQLSMLGGFLKEHHEDSSLRVLWDDHFSLMLQSKLLSPFTLSGIMNAFPFTQNRKLRSQYLKLIEANAEKRISCLAPSLVSSLLVSISNLRSPPDINLMIHAGESIAEARQFASLEVLRKCVELFSQTKTRHENLFHSAASTFIEQISNRKLSLDEIAAIIDSYSSLGKSVGELSWAVRDVYLACGVEETSIENSITICWSLAVSGTWDKAILDKFWLVLQSCSDSDWLAVPPALRAKLYETTLFAKSFHRKSQFVIPEEVSSRVFECRVSHMASEHHDSSSLVSLVRSCLRELEPAKIREDLSESVETLGLSVDVPVLFERSYKRVAVLLVPQSQFARQRTALLGKMMLKSKILENLGWSVVMFPIPKLEAFRSANGQRRFIIDTVENLMKKIESGIPKYNWKEVLQQSVATCSD